LKSCFLDKLLLEELLLECSDSAPISAGEVFKTEADLQWSLEPAS
jgi:hypothetical protein